MKMKIKSDYRIAASLGQSTTVIPKIVFTMALSGRSSEAI